MAVLDVTGIDNIGGMNVGVAVDCEAVTMVALAANVLVFTVSVINVGYGLPGVVLTVAAAMD